MPIYTFRLLFVSFIILNLLSCSNNKESIESPDSVNQYDTVELVLHSRKSYNSYTPWFNPFTQINLDLELYLPSGRVIVVPGFFDGNGLGGNFGRVFKFRLCPDEPGMWRWKITSDLVEFNGQIGSFIVAGNIDGMFSRGPVSISKSNPRAFELADQTPYFLIGKFLDFEQPPHLRFSHTLFSEQWSNFQQEQLVDHQLSMGINKINIYVANKGDYDGIATTPWFGTASFNIKSRFDLSRWHLYEEWLKRLRNEGIVAHLWFFADDSDFGGIKKEDRDLLIRYGMSRMSGYVNTMFTLALEWQEGFDEHDIRQAGLLAQNVNPWDRLISVHGISVTENVEKFTTFFNEDWLDFIDIQTGFLPHNKTYKLGVLYRNQAKKPLIMEEFSAGENNADQRVNTWSALLSMPAGIGTGTGLNVISEFVRHVDVTTMDPAPELITTENAYAAKSSDGHAVIYIFETGPVGIHASILADATARWFDPRNGVFVDLEPDIENGQLIPPSGQDWVLVIKPG